MASERQITLIKRIVFLLLFLAIAVAVWFYQPKKKAPRAEVVQEQEKEPPVQRGKVKEQDGKPGEGHGAMTVYVEANNDVSKVMKNVVSPENGVAIVHCHLPGDPASEQMADVLNAIKGKYGKLVSIVRVGFPAQPLDWQVQKGIKLPYFMMIVGTENAFQFQGVWPQPKVEKKVEELIFGVRRVGKDWRPVVPGMTPKSH